MIIYRKLILIVGNEKKKIVNGDKRNGANYTIERSHNLLYIIVTIRTDEKSGCDTAYYVSNRRFPTCLITSVSEICLWSSKNPKLALRNNSIRKEEKDTWLARRIVVVVVIHSTDKYEILFLFSLDNNAIR